MEYHISFSKESRENSLIRFTQPGLKSCTKTLVKTSENTSLFNEEGHNNVSYGGEEDHVETNEEELPRTLEEALLEKAGCFAKSACMQVNKYWQSVTDYSGPPLTLDGVKASINSATNYISVKAKCHVCEKFIALNMTAQNRLSIRNFKVHATSQHVMMKQNNKRLPIKKEKPDIKGRITHFFGGTKTTVQQETVDLTVFAPTEIPPSGRNFEVIENILSDSSEQLQEEIEEEKAFGTFEDSQGNHDDHDNWSEVEVINETQASLLSCLEYSENTVHPVPLIEVISSNLSSTATMSETIDEKQDTIEFDSEVLPAPINFAAAIKTEPINEDDFQLDAVNSGN